MGRTTSPLMARGVQRTSSLGFSRTSSFESIHEDNNDDRPDQEDSFKKVSHMPSTSSHSSLLASSPVGSVRRTGSTKDVLFDGSAKDVSAQNSQGSITSVASSANAFRRPPSNASRSPLVRRPSAHSGSSEEPRASRHWYGTTNGVV